MIYALIAVVVLVAIFAVIVAKQPSDFRITRSATMNAPPSAVFAQVNDFHNWKAWSPWERMDPDLNRTYEGPAVGVGATYSWSGNKKVGEGRMTIIESRPNDLIRIKLEFLKPFKATNEAEYTFQGAGQQTEMVWSMKGCKNCIFKIFGLLMNMDDMVGKDFERGLANLKEVVEGV